MATWCSGTASDSDMTWFALAVLAVVIGFVGRRLFTHLEQVQAHGVIVAARLDLVRQDLAAIRAEQIVVRDGFDELVVAVRDAGVRISTFTLPQPQVVKVEVP